MCIDKNDKKQSKDPNRGIDLSNKKTLVSRELTSPAVKHRYRDVAQVGGDPEKCYRLQIPVMTWIPLSEENPIQMGFPENSDLFLFIPRREIVDPVTELQMPWFFNHDRYQPIFPEAVEKIAKICEARPAADLKNAFKGKASIGVLPGFFYETDDSIDFRVSPQSLYSSHILFFTTGYTYNQKLLELAELATESSIRFKARLVDGAFVTFLIMHTYLLAKALQYKNSVELLLKLFIEPFNRNYKDTMKLATRRVEATVSFADVEGGKRLRANFTKIIDIFNSASRTYWECFARPYPHARLSSMLLDPPHFTLTDQALIYAAQGRERLLKIHQNNLVVLKMMTRTVQDALNSRHTMKERERIFFQIFSTDNRFEEFGAKPSLAILRDSDDGDEDDGDYSQPN